MGPSTPKHASAVLDASLSWVAGGSTDCTRAEQVATGQSGPGYLTIVNRSDAWIYIGVTGLTGSTNGQPIPPSGSDTCFWEDVSTVFAIGSSTVGWSVRR